MSMPSQMRCVDGRYVNTGLPPRTPQEFAQAARVAARARARGGASRGGLSPDGSRAGADRSLQDRDRRRGDRHLRCRPRGAHVHRQSNHRAGVLPRSAAGGPARRRDLFTRGGVRGCALRRPRHAGRGRAAAARSQACVTPGRRTPSRRPAGRSRARRPGSASTPKRCWPRSGSTRPVSGPRGCSAPRDRREVDRPGPSRSSRPAHALPRDLLE